MQYLGTAQAPAPMLQHARLENPEAFLRATENGIEGLAEAGIIHSDLSPFNILVHEGTPWFIDLAAGIRVDRLGSPPWERLHQGLTALGSGIASLQRYFRKYDLRVDAPALTARVQAQIDRYRVGDIEVSLD